MQDGSGELKECGRQRADILTGDERQTSGDITAVSLIVHDRQPFLG